MPEPEQNASARGRCSTLANLALLLGGFGLGQGSIFVAQTWLVAIGDYHFLAAFGTHFLFAVLGIFGVDAGSITTLARHAAASSRDADGQRQLWQAFCATSMVRLALALVMVTAAIVYALSPAADDFSRNYALLAAPAFLIVAGNAAGLLDGFRFSGVSGVSAAIPYAMSALVLTLVRHASPDTAGVALGAAFSVGCLLTVVVQWIVLARLGSRPKLQVTTARGLRIAVREAGAMLGVVLPGQLYGRAQLVLSATYLGPETTALFLYAKQLVSAAIQVVQFIQRVEFPTLVARLSVPTANLFRTILNAQKLMAACGIVATLAVLVAGLVAVRWPESRFNAVGPLVSAFAPTILTSTVLLIMIQALAAMAAYDGLALDIIIINLMGAVTSYLLLKGVGVYAFVAGDLSSVLCGIVLVMLRLDRSRQTLAAAAGARP
jgi:hypothetical protein